jgi:hypothetical protein
MTKTYTYNTDTFSWRLYLMYCSAIKSFVYQEWINDREYRCGNQNRTIQRNRQNRVHKTKTNKTKTQHSLCWTHHYAQTNTNNVNKICTFLQTTEGKDEPNIISCGNRFYGCQRLYYCLFIALAVLPFTVTVGSSIMRSCLILIWVWNDL